MGTEGPGRRGRVLVVEYRERWTASGLVHSPCELDGKWYGRGTCPWLQSRCWTGYIDPVETGRLQAQWEKAGRPDEVIFDWLKGQYAAMMSLAATRAAERPGSNASPEQEP